MHPLPYQAAWNRVAQSHVETIKGCILSRYRHGSPFAPDVPDLLDSHYPLVLDFGCGLGRNFPLLKAISNRVHAYDLPDMVAKCRCDGPEQVDLLTADWLEIAQHRYSLVYASLVVQHLDLVELEFFLVEWASLATRVYLHTRSYLDDGRDNVLAKILEWPLFRVERCSLSVADALQLQFPDETHFEVLLKSLN